MSRARHYDEVKVTTIVCKLECDCCSDSSCRGTRFHVQKTSPSPEELRPDHPGSLAALTVAMAVAVAHASFSRLHHRHPSGQGETTSTWGGTEGAADGDTSAAAVGEHKAGEEILATPFSPRYLKVREKAAEGEHRSLPIIVGAKKKLFFGTIYQDLVDMPLRTLLLTSLLSLFTITACFAFVNGVLIPSESFSPPKHSSVDILLYSVGFVTTFGQANITPVGVDALLAGNLQALFMEIMLVFVTGVVFTRLSRPRLELSMSSRIIFGCGYAPGLSKNEKVVVCRVFFHHPKDSLIDCRYVLTFTRRIHDTMHGEMYFKTSTLALVKSEQPKLFIGTEIVHVINEESPLAGWSSDDFKKSHGTFQVTIFATEASTMQPMVFSRRYEALPRVSVEHDISHFKKAGQIVFGGRFHPCGRVDPSLKKYVIDVSLIDVTIGSTAGTPVVADKKHT